MKKQAMALVLLLAVFTLIACSDPLLGSWALSGSDILTVYEFLPDGGFSMYTPGDEGWNIEGSYEVRDHRLILMIHGQPTALDYQLEGDNLTLTGEKMTGRLTRIPGKTP